MFDNLYRLECFAVNSFNEEAMIKCKSICESPQLSSGLWICGPSGCGKTYLLKAVYRSLLSRQSGKNGLAISGVELAERLYRYLGDETEPWLEVLWYDVLLVDNLEDLLGKPKTQEEIGRLLAKMRANDRTVLLASTCAPYELPGLQEGLKSSHCLFSTAVITSAGFSSEKSLKDMCLQL